MVGVFERYGGQQTAYVAYSFFEDVNWVCTLHNHLCDVVQYDPGQCLSASEHLH